jgi:hypothetical protein
MSETIEAMHPEPLPSPRDDLASGSLFVELQVSSWPPPVTQTLLRNRDSRSSLTIRAKPSGRLRIELELAGRSPVVVRTVHLRLRAPGLIRLNVAWRGDVAVVAAGGQIIGSSNEAIPAGVSSPELVAETAAPPDHADNERARAQRRRHVETYLNDRDIDSRQVKRWIAALDDSVSALRDLVQLVRQGHRHHLPVMVDVLVRLVCGDRALLQWCAGTFDVPLTVYAPPTPPQATSPGALLAAAFDVAAVRIDRYSFAVDIDTWLRHEHSWLPGRHVPVEALLLAIDGTLTPPLDHVESQDNRAIRVSCAQPQSVAALCNFATVVCALAVSVVVAAAEPATSGFPQPQPQPQGPMVPLDERQSADPTTE